MSLTVTTIEKKARVKKTFTHETKRARIVNRAMPLGVLNVVFLVFLFAHFVVLTIVLLNALKDESEGEWSEFEEYHRTCYNV